jgi:predicted nucleic acid-binding protein
MVLVDTSVWIDHFRRANADLAQLLLDQQVLCHRFVIGELACGHLVNRKQILTDLSALPQVQEATHEEAFAFVDRHALHGSGVGWVDVHLLASCLLSRVRIWSRDKPVRRAAQVLSILY